MGTINQLFLIFFLLDIFFIYISNVIPFPGFPSKKPLSHPLSPYLPTHPLPLSCPGIPLYWGIKPSQDQGPLLLLMSHKAILCYICDRSHESLYVYSMVDDLVPGSSWGPGWLVLLFFLWGCKPLHLLQSFNSSTGDPMLSPMDGCEHPPLYLSGSGKAAQETAKTGPCQQALPGIHNSVQV